MTLYKQLLTSVSVLFATLLIVVYFVEFNSSKESLAEQQTANVINTSNSLGLALTPYLDSGDKVGAESVIKAVFDGGLYKKISLELYSSNQIISSENSEQILGVPHWFSSLHLFTEAKYEQTLTSGWLQLGQIEVIGHQGYAYQQLWRSMSDLFILFLISYFVTIIILVRGLSYLLRPLNQIRQQAVEIQHRHPGHHIPLPKTQELKELVTAINLMSAKLSQQFKEQASEAEALRRSAYQDAVSTLGNRAYFVSQVNTWVAEGGRGGVVLVAADILDNIYREEGFAARDDLVRTIAFKLKEEINSLEHAALARISAIEFAILLPGIEDNELLEMGDKLKNTICDLIVNPMGDIPHVCTVGLSQRNKDEGVGELLTLADNALQAAKANNDNKPVLAASSDHNSLGRIGWKTLVKSAVDKDLMRFKVQPVVLLSDGNIFHVELFTSIQKDGITYHAGQFLPAVEQYKIGPQFDRYVLNQVIVWLEDSYSEKIAVNLTSGALKDSDFLTWLLHFMEVNKQFSDRLAFELPEAVLVDCKEEIESLCHAIHRLGFSFGVDQYGRHIQSLDYLAKLRPSYVKIDFGYTAQVLQEQADNQFLVSICKAAHNLKILTIAQRIETNQQMEALEGLYIDGYQGYIQPPVELVTD